MKREIHAKCEKAPFYFFEGSKGVGWGGGNMGYNENYL